MAINETVLERRLLSLLLKGHGSVRCRRDLPLDRTRPTADSVVFIAGHP
jgi:hypothetical protein